MFLLQLIEPNEVAIADCGRDMADAVVFVIGRVQNQEHPDKISTGMDGPQFLAHLAHVSRNGTLGNPCNSAEPTPISTAPRRFPPPWTIEDNGAAFIVKDTGTIVRRQ